MTGDYYDRKELVRYGLRHSTIDCLRKLQSKFVEHHALHNNQTI